MGGSLFSQFENTKKSTESFIDSSGFTLLESKIINTSQGKKYTAYFEYIQNEIKYKQRLIYFDCGSYGYQVGIECSGEQITQENIKNMSHILESIFCERRKEEAEEKIESALAKMEQVRDNGQLKDFEAMEIISEAIKDGRKATELDFGNSEIWFQRGNLYFEIMDSVEGSKKSAVGCYENAIELDPNNTIYKEKLEEAKFFQEK